MKDKKQKDDRKSKLIPIVFSIVGKTLKWAGYGIAAIIVLRILKEYLDGDDDCDLSDGGDGVVKVIEKVVHVVAEAPRPPMDFPIFVHHK